MSSPLSSPRVPRSATAQPPAPHHSGVGTPLPVALDVTPALRQTAGVGRYTRELARALIRRGTLHYVLFAADRPGRARASGRLDFGPRAPALRWSRLPARWHTLWWHRLGWPLSPERWTGPVAVFHSTDFLAPPVRRARVVVTVHDLSFLLHPERADPALARFLSARVPAAVQRADHVLADSANTRRDLLERLGVAEERVSVAYPGVGTEFTAVLDAERRAAVRRRYELPVPFILGVGTLEPRKDWPLLMDAFLGAGPALASHQLVIAGGAGWGMGPIADAARAAGGRVRLLGFVREEDLPVLYSLADAFAYPSVYEGFGLPPLEAMACGTPTVVSSASCLPEVVGDGAVVVPVGDGRALSRALVQLTGDAALRRELVARGPARAATFTWDACAQATEAVYASLA